MLGRGAAEVFYDTDKQDGGDADIGHRCVGERLTIAIMECFATFLAREITHDVPPQDLTIDLSRMPALPASGTVLTNVRKREP